MKELPTPTFPLSPAFLVRSSSFLGIAQRLRFDVFAGEMGARLETSTNTVHPGHDIDMFDDFCEHLLVRDKANGQVVGTYRVLTPAQAKRIGTTYTDTEFDLTRLRSMRERMVELGRSCVHKDYRHGGVIMGLGGLFVIAKQIRNGYELPVSGTG